MRDSKKRPDEGPALNYPNARRDARWQSHVGTRPESEAEYDGSSTLVRRSWFGRFLARKTQDKK